MSLKSDNIEKYMASKEDLEKLQSTMVSKTDVKKLKTELLKETKALVFENVQPVKDEIFDMKKEINALSGRVIKMESNPGTSSQAYTKISLEIKILLDSLDPAHKRISFQKDRAKRMQ